MGPSIGDRETWLRLKDKGYLYAGFVLDYECANTVSVSEIYFKLYDFNDVCSLRIEFPLIAQSN